MEEINRVFNDVCAIVDELLDAAFSKGHLCHLDHGLQVHDQAKQMLIVGRVSVAILRARPALRLCATDPVATRVVSRSPLRAVFLL